MSSIRKFIDRIAGIGLNDSVADDQIVKIKILNVICVIAILVVAIFYSLRDLALERYYLALFHFLLVLVFIPPLLFNANQKFHSARIYLFVLFPFALIPYNYFLADVGSENYLFSLVLLSFLLFDRIKTRFVFAFLSASVFIAIKIMLKNEWNLSYYADSSDELFYFNTSQSFLFVTFFSFVYSYQNDQHLKKIKSINKDLKASNDLIKNLLKELNHRVINNLQLMSSMFSIQSSETSNEELKEKLNEARNRISTLSAVYEKLYAEKSASKIGLNDYIKELSESLQSQVSNQKVSVQLEIPEELVLELEETVHLGLIINELLTNGMKYAVNGKRGELSLSILHLSKGIHLVYSDNGPGFPNDFDVKNSSFGYQLMNILTSKYSGDIYTFNDPGAVVEINLPGIAQRSN